MTTAAQVSEIAMIGFTVSDMTRAVDFYERVLGFKKIADTQVTGDAYDMLSGVLASNMRIAVQRAYEATPAPKLVVAIGDCGCTGGIFGESYASCGRVANVIPVDVAVPGCPPAPVEILRGILTAVRSTRA